MKDHEINLGNDRSKKRGDKLMDNEKKEWHWVGGLNEIKIWSREDLGINKL